MKISIITSCLNREETISESILSVLYQDFPMIEYVVVDGASHDQTVAVAKKTLLSLPYQSVCYQEKQVTTDWLMTADSEVWKQGFTVKTPTSTIHIKLISDPDKGMYEAINKGIRLCTGDVIGMVHSDDTLNDNHVLSDYASAFEQTQADLIYADGTYVKKEDTSIAVRHWPGAPFARWKLYLSWLPLHTTTYIRRATYERLGLYDTRYKIAADTDLLLRFLFDKQLKAHYLGKRNVVRMKMGGLSTNAQRRRQVWNEDIAIYKEHHFLIPHLAKLFKMAWKVPQVLFK